MATVYSVDNSDYLRLDKWVAVFRAVKVNRETDGEAGHLTVNLHPNPAGWWVIFEFSSGNPTLDHKDDTPSPLNNKIEKTKYLNKHIY